MLNVQPKETVASGNLKHNQVTVGVSAVQLSPSSYNFRFGVLVRADSSNTHPVYLGGAGVTSANGLPLLKGNSVILPIEDSIDLYCISTAVAQNVAWLGV